MNGEILHTETLSYTSEEITNDKMWIGGIPDDNWYDDKRMEGAITGVHVWNVTLELKKLEHIIMKGMKGLQNALFCI